MIPARGRFAPSQWCDSLFSIRIHLRDRRRTDDAPGRRRVPLARGRVVGELCGGLKGLPLQLSCAADGKGAEFPCVQAIPDHDKRVLPLNRTRCKKTEPMGSPLEQRTSGRNGSGLGGVTLYRGCPYLESLGTGFRCTAGIPTREIGEAWAGERCSIRDWWRTCPRCTEKTVI